MIDSGDPCVFGPSHRVIEELREDEVEIVPGLGCFQAMMAALKKSSIPAYDTRFVMLTAPMFLFGRPEDEAIIKAEKESWLGMIIVGRCLEGQPQRGMVKLLAQ